MAQIDQDAATEELSLPEANLFRSPTPEVRHEWPRARSPVRRLEPDPVCS